MYVVSVVFTSAGQTSTTVHLASRSNGVGRCMVIARDRDSPCTRNHHRDFSPAKDSRHETDRNPIHRDRRVEIVYLVTLTIHHNDGDRIHRKTILAINKMSRALSLLTKRLKSKSVQECRWRYVSFTVSRIDLMLQYSSNMSIAF